MFRLYSTSLIASVIFAGLASAQTYILPPRATPLQGVAAVTRASGGYLKDVQQARYMLEKARQERLVTARQRVEFEQWLESQRPTAASIRAREYAVALNSARQGATENEITSARPLNILLASIQASGNHGPEVAIAPAVTARLNLSGSTSANPGALRYGEKIRWPEALLEEEYDPARDRLTKNLRLATSELKNGEDLSVIVVREIRKDHKAMSDLLDRSAANVTPSRWCAARRFLRELNESINGLTGPNATKQYGDTWTAKGKSVGELVEHMTSQGLKFSPAAPGDEAAYRAVYNALRTYESRLVASNR